MMMALLLMFVAVMVSAVIISSVISATTAIRNDKQQQQAYLSVSSAVELIRDELDSGNCDYSIETVKKYGTDSDRENDKNVEATIPTEKEGSGIFWEIIKSGIDYLDKNPAAAFDKTYTINADGNDSVSAEVAMKLDSSGNYTLTVWFVGGGTEKYRICMTAEGIKTEDSADSEEKESSGWWPWGGTKVKYYVRTTTSSIQWKNTRVTRKEA